MRLLVLALILVGALVVLDVPAARADVCAGPVCVPQCVPCWRPCMPVYVPRCPPRFCMPAGYRPARRATCITPCGPCYMPCGGWCGRYYGSRSYPGPIFDFGNRNRWRRW